MSKFDFTSTINKVQATYKKDERRASQFGLGNSLESVSLDPADYVVMPDEFNFKENFGIPGVPFGKFVQISGKPDAGKTTMCLQAIKAAQQQGYGVVYVETEGKTGPERLIEEGIDPNGVMTINTNITEEVFDGLNRSVDAFFMDYPTEKLLVVVDSYGNTTSMRDSAIDLTDKAGKVGGAAATNRLGLGAIRAKQVKFPIAVLIVNYSYANIGSVGETNAGGRALEFLCSLIINASRKAWYERTKDGVKVRAGADVLWKTTKNHAAIGLKDEDGNDKLLPKQVVYRISGDGIQQLEPKK